MQHQLYMENVKIKEKIIYASLDGSLITYLCFVLITRIGWWCILGENHLSDTKWKLKLNVRMCYLTKHVVSGWLYQRVVFKSFLDFTTVLLRIIFFNKKYQLSSFLSINSFVLFCFFLFYRFGFVRESYLQSCSARALHENNWISNSKQRNEGIMINE